MISSDFTPVQFSQDQPEPEFSSLHNCPKQITGSITGTNKTAHTDEGHKQVNHQTATDYKLLNPTDYNNESQ
jgi:hypothetical protein